MRFAINGFEPFDPVTRVKWGIRPLGVDIESIHEMDSKLHYEPVLYIVSLSIRCKPDEGEPGEHKTFSLPRGEMAFTIKQSLALYMYRQKLTSDGVDFLKLVIGEKRDAYEWMIASIAAATTLDGVSIVVYKEVNSDSFVL